MNTSEERKEYLREYYIKNKEKRKLYLEKNKEKISEKAKLRSKKYYEKNKEYVKENQKKYNEKNKEYINEKQKEYRLVNKLKNNEYNRKYYKENKERLLEQQKNYATNNRIKINENNKKRKNNDPKYKLITNVRSYLSTILKEKRKPKNSKTETILGCTFDDFKKHIESLWQPWMNWDNYGNPKDGVLEPNKTWDIDHIIPLSSAKTEEELYNLFKYSNTQPLCSYHNRLVKKNQ